MKKPEEEKELWVEFSKGVGMLINGIKSSGSIV